MFRNTVRLERTGFRDDVLLEHIRAIWGDGFIMLDISQKDLPNSISVRHREWGFDCPATNIDCVMCEYDHKIPQALIEFKGRSPQSGDKTSANSQTIINLANMADLPCFILYYNNSNWTFLILPLNKKAEQKYANWMKSFVNFPESGWISEFAAVTFLYYLRNRLIPQDILEKLQK